MATGIRIAIDRGGTFTDCIGACPGKDNVVIKLLSEDPANYKDAPHEAIRRVLECYTGSQIPRNSKLDTSQIESIRMGTTVATNALLQRKGERTAFITTKGFKDLLVIGNQARPDIFALDIQRPEVLYEQVLEIDERVTLEDYVEHPLKLKTDAEKVKADPNLTIGLSGEVVRILKAPDLEQVEKDLKQLYQDGFRSLAVCLVLSYTFHDHEKAIGKIADRIGFTNVSLSSQLMPMIKAVPRATSSTADAYLTPEIKRYLNGFQEGFEGTLGASRSSKQSDITRCEFMQSDGGLVDIKRFSGLKAILSGPAGGVVGYALTSYDPETKIPVIGFDMGGTSTDVSRYGGHLEHVFETTTAGITIQSPQLDISTVAAGGGSKLFWRNGLFVVGPESAGAHPGPACYRKGGPLCITDANLVLGRLLPDFFPKIFGPNENEGLDIDASKRLFAELASIIEADGGPKLSIHEVAYGFIRVANETMTRPIRSLTEAKGYDVQHHRLAPFGGAGGQHAVAIARNLGIKQVLIHKYSSVLSAYGMALADVVNEQQEPFSGTLTDASLKEINKRFEILEDKACQALADQGFSRESTHYQHFINMRYQGTESGMMVARPEGVAASSYSSNDFKSQFQNEYQKEFGFILRDRDILVDDIRVRGTGNINKITEKSVDKQLKEIKEWKEIPLSSMHSREAVYFEDGWEDAPVFKLDALPVPSKVRGPVMLADGTQTIVLPPFSSAKILHTHVVIKTEDDGASERTDRSVNSAADHVDFEDPILLSIFGHRFMAIAEQMGHALQKTSVSTNVKERLDFSCALFDSKGGLVANAPHLPVHLGSMSTAVRKQAQIWDGKLKPGDVLVSNHPQFGGTHLPDITVITPAFHNGEIIFYVAARAHHADIGSITAGSMPPFSRRLFQEGAMIKSEKLVSEGHFNEARMKELLLDEPAKYPGCSGTRCLRDNISDLKAQIAANHRGINLIKNLIDDYGQVVVDGYMLGIQKNAELSVRNLLKKVGKSLKVPELDAVDFMDDGSVIKLSISLNIEEGSAIFDFTGTSPEVYGNTNAPEAVTYSAILYCLRCMISESIPLNQGCLTPIKIIIPKGSLLSPGEGAAVVGGNVLTSQRVTDVIFLAFESCAASQGDCNNLTFGMGGQDGESEQKSKHVAGWGYYETIAGGSGAGPGYNGTSGVHTHMTNTRITDPEIFERRYPVLLRQFSLRPGSGGDGEFKGGDGVIRDIEFREPVECSILSERRVHHPYGLKGGQPAKCGLNEWVHKDGYRVNLTGKNTVPMAAGDRIIIQTPGGGGWGMPSDNRIAS